MSLFESISVDTLVILLTIFYAILLICYGQMRYWKGKFEENGEDGGWENEALWLRSRLEELQSKALDNKVD
jgi:hypothetical protein